MSEQDAAGDKQVQFRCAACGESMSSSYLSIGDWISCPGCEQKGRVPLPELPLFGLDAANDAMSGGGPPPLSAERVSIDAKQEESILDTVSNKIINFKRRRKLKQELVELRQSVGPTQVRLSSAHFSLGQALWRLDEVRQLQTPIVADLLKLDQSRQQLQAQLSQNGLAIERLEDELEQRVNVWKQEHESLLVAQRNCEEIASQKLASREKALSQYDEVLAEMRATLEPQRQLLKAVTSTSRSTPVKQTCEMLQETGECFKESQHKLEQWQEQLNELRDRIQDLEEQLRQSRGNLDTESCKVREHEQVRVGFEREATQSRQRCLRQNEQLQHELDQLTTQQKHALMRLAEVVRQVAPAFAEPLPENQEVITTVETLERTRARTRQLEDELYYLDQ